MLALIMEQAVVSVEFLQVVVELEQDLINQVEQEVQVVEVEVLHQEFLELLEQLILEVVEVVVITAALMD
jgi:hypothetical protein